MGKFYVYEHVRPDTGNVFYVGKGQKRRAWDMHRGRNKWHIFVISKMKRLGTPIQVRIAEEFSDESLAFEREIQLIAHWRSAGMCLVNITTGGEGGSGRKHTAEWKQENSKRMKGRKLSEETKAKIAAFHKGKRWSLGTKRTPEQIEATASASRGKPKSDETRRKISEAKTGKPGHAMTDEVIEKIRIAQAGRPKSAECRANMRGIPKSAEHRRKLSEINKGKIHSEETRRLLSEIAKADWARRKSAIAFENRE